MNGTPKIHFDDFDHIEFRGWAWSPSDTSTSPIADLIVSCGSTALGRKRRNVPHPDTDATVGDQGSDKGFVLPIVPLFLLGQIVGDSRKFNSVIHLGDHTVSAAELPPRFSDISTFRSLVLAEERGPVKITDLWFATSHHLRLRFEPTPQTKTLGPVTFRFYQPKLHAAVDEALTLICERVEERIELTFITVPLINPFLPLLIAVLTSDDEILAADLLPYPSLCRGGLHAAELAACRLAGTGLSELRVLSDSLAREFVGWSGAASTRSVGQIEIDAFGASGSEPIFGTDMLEWLAGMFGIAPQLSRTMRPALHPLPDTEFVEHLKEKLSAAPPAKSVSDAQPLLLTIPGHGVPTISALVSRRLANSVGNEATSAPFLVSENGTGRPRWLVSLPSLGGWLDGLQPATGAATYPTLSRSGSGGSSRGQASMPAAILLLNPPSRDSALRLFPISPDFQGPLLRAGNAGVDPREQMVSIVVAVREHDRRFEMFLEFAARQTVAGRIEMIVVDNRSQRLAESSMRAALNRTFPDAHKILDYDETFNHSAQINLGVRNATGRFILVANSSVIFHDPRTVGLLLRLASEPEVATASCMLLHRPTGSSDIAFRSAGYFPGAINFLAGPHVSLTEPDCDEALPLATYPVAANSLDLMMVRAEVFAELGGLDERNFPHSHDDIDFATRAMSKNLLHVCTTAMSAYCERRRTRGTLTDVSAGGIAQTAALADLLAKAAVLRKL